MNAGDTANLTNSPSAGSETVNLGQAITVGTINIGDANRQCASFTVAPSDSGTLTLNNSGAGASINEMGGASGEGDSDYRPAYHRRTL